MTRIFVGGRAPNDIGHVCDQCEGISGCYQSTLVWKVPKSEEEFTLCFDCLMKEFFKHIAPSLKKNDWKILEKHFSLNIKKNNGKKIY